MSHKRKRDDYDDNDDNDEGDETNNNNNDVVPESHDTLTIQSAFCPNRQRVIVQRLRKVVSERRMLDCPARFATFPPAAVDGTCAYEDLAVFFGTYVSERSAWREILEALFSNVHSKWNGRINEWIAIHSRVHGIYHHQPVFRGTYLAYLLTGGRASEAADLILDEWRHRVDLESWNVMEQLDEYGNVIPTSYATLDIATHLPVVQKRFYDKLPPAAFATTGTTAMTQLLLQPGRYKVLLTMDYIRPLVARAGRFGDAIDNTVIGKVPPEALLLYNVVMGSYQRHVRAQRLRAENDARNAFGDTMFHGILGIGVLVLSYYYELDDSFLPS